MNINGCYLTGNLTRDPEVRQVGDSSVCELGVAVNTRVKQNGEWTDYANFFDVSVWGGQADACAKYLDKGSPVAIEGELRQERWQDKNTGDNRSKVRIRARSVQFLSNRDSDSPPRQSNQDSGFPEFDGEDIPF